MEKTNWKKRFAELKERVEKGDPRPRVTEKICPFMSTADKLVACTPQCKFYRADKKGFECYFMELRSISWSLRNVEKSLKELKG